MKHIQRWCIFGILGLLSACSWWNNDEQESPFKDVPAPKLYKEAKQSLAKKEYESAIKRYEAMETLYPFHEHAEQAQMDLMYAYYRKGDYASAAASAERFIHLYPRAKKVDYAYYMKALANFQQPRGTLTAIFPIDESWRDPGTQLQAYSDFATLVQQFPDSPYRANAMQRMIYLRNMFAQHELNVSNYYFSRRMYVAAVERASYLVKTYPQAPSVKEALVNLYKGNKALGLNDAAEDALRVYEATYHRRLPV